MSVTLGLPGAWANDNYEASDHYTSKIGGLPDFPFRNVPLRPSFLQCCQCGCNLCLVSQVYAPISFSTHKIQERVIYVFGCVSPKCGSWRAVRVQKLDVTTESKPSSQEVAPASGSNRNWWDDLCSFSSEGDEDYDDNHDMDLVDLGRALSEAGSLASCSKKQNLKQSATVAKPFSSSPKVKETCTNQSNTLVLPCFYLYLENEAQKDVTSICLSYNSLSIKTYQEDDGNNDPEENWQQEGYEHDRALSADRTYLKFKKRIDAYPDQCFRYAYGGKPLLAMVETGDPGTCSLCGGSRHYELQLMPPLLHFLQEAATNDEKDLLENWNWMTLLVYTCSQSCFKKVDKESPDLDGWTVAEDVVIAQVETSLKASSSLHFLP